MPQEIAGFPVKQALESAEHDALVLFEQLALASVAGGLNSRLLHLCACDEQMNRALHFAARKLEGRYRGPHREPALIHAVRVAAIAAFVFGMRQPDGLAAALLHDLLEDSDTEPEELVSEFGDSVADAVVLLTKPILYSKTERKRIYEDALAAAPDDVVLIKLADYYDNLHCRCGTRRLEKTKDAASRLLCRLGDRQQLTGRTRRAARLVQEFLAEITAGEGHSPLPAVTDHSPVQISSAA